MRATQEDRERLEVEIQRLVEQLKTLGAVKVILFGSLARGQISLFSDIDLLVLFEDGRSSRELTNGHTRIYMPGKRSICWLTN